MKSMKKLAFAAALLLSLAASGGDAFAATVDAHTNVAIVDGRGNTNPRPPSTVPGANRRSFGALGATWE